MSELLALVGPLASLAPTLVAPFILLATRLSLVVFLMPGLGATVLPVRVRIAVVLALSLALFPVVVPHLGVADTLFVLLVGEAFAGFVLGFLVRVFAYALSIAGTIIAQSLNLSQIFGASMTEEANSTIATLLSLAGATLFLTVGLHIVVFELLLESYKTVPPGTVFDGGWTGETAERAVTLCAAAFGLAVTLSLPFLVMNFVYYCLLGLMNRAMPQLMVTFVGMPAMILAGLGFLMVAAGVILTIWLSRIADLLMGGFG